MTAHPKVFLARRAATKKFLPGQIDIAGSLGAADEIHQAINDVFGPNDHEQLAMQKGFALLDGQPPDFGQRT